MIVRELIALFSAQVDRNSFAAGTREFARFENEVGSRMFRLRTAVGTTIGLGLTAMVGSWAEDAARFADANRMFEAAGGNLDDLRKKTRGLIDDMTLVKTANLAEQFGFGDTYSDLVKVADAAAKKFGESQSDILESLIRGIGRKSPARLDNPGLLITVAEVKNHAASLGMDYDQLPELQKRRMYALLAIKQGNKMVEEMKKAGAIESDIFDNLKTAMSGVRLEVGKTVLQLVVAFYPAMEEAGKLIKDMAVALRFTTEEAANSEGVAKTIGRVFEALFSGLRMIPKFMTEFPKLSKVLLGLLLFIPVKAAVFGVVAAMSKALPIVAYLTGALGLGTAGAASFLRVLLGVKMALMSLGVGLAIAVAIAAWEELFALFDDTKLGMFEAYAGKWDTITAALWNSESAAAKLLIPLTAIIHVLDKLASMPEMIHFAFFDEGHKERAGAEWEADKGMAAAKLGGDSLKKYQFLAQYAPGRATDAYYAPDFAAAIEQNYNATLDSMGGGKGNVTNINAPKSLAIKIEGADVSPSQLAHEVAKHSRTFFENEMANLVESGVPEGSGVLK